MRITKSLVATLLTAAALSPAGAQQSSSNGVYGGYVGSDAWFKSMTRRSPGGAGAAHAGWQANNDKALASGKWTELKLTIAFPQGNPFPGGRVPDLSVVGPDGKDMGVRPWPDSTDRNGAHYTLVLPKNATYRLRWSAYVGVGGKSQFGRIQIPPNIGAHSHATIQYRPGSPIGGGHPGPGHYSPPQSEGNVPHPQSDNDFHGPRSDSSYQAPRSDYRPPQSDGGYHAPKSDGDYKPPR